MVFPRRVLETREETRRLGVVLSLTEVAEGLVEVVLSLLEAAVVEESPLSELTPRVAQPEQTEAILVGASQLPASPQTQYSAAG